MRRINRSWLGLLLAVPVLVLLSGCSVNVKKQANGQEKQVDISTPMGGIHVNKDVDVADVGLSVYPGARRKQDSDNDKGANVNISGFGFGLKVVALEYESDDAPDKVISFYKDQLKKYGAILVCHTSGFDVDADVKTHNNESSHDLTCEGSSGTNVELKVGTKENQHIVAVKPEGKGSNFSLVYVRTHGRDADI